MWPANFMDLFVLLSTLTTFIETSPPLVKVDWPFLNKIAFEKSEWLEGKIGKLDMHPHYGRIVGHVSVHRTENETLEHFLTYCSLEIVLVYFNS